MFRIRLIIIGVVAHILILSVFNASGLSITKYASWVNRITIYTIKTAVIWVISVSINAGPLNQSFYLLQLAGFIFIIIGSFAFNILLDRTKKNAYVNLSQTLDRDDPMFLESSFDFHSETLMDEK